MAVSLCLTLLLASSAAPAVLAAPSEGQLIAEGTLNETGPCQDTGPNNTHNGNSIYSFTGNNHYRSIRATINPVAATFKTCGSNDGLGDGTLAWIAVAPRDFINSSALIQVGIARCGTIASLVCPWPRQDRLRFFYADGGCNGNAAVPESINVNGNYGDASPHHYRIEWWNGSQSYKISIDGVIVKTLYGTDAAVNCWANPTNHNNPVIVELYGETWDRGDGSADSTDKLNFTAIEFQSESTNYTEWRDPCTGCGYATQPWVTGNNCYPGGVDTNVVDHRCWITGTQSFDIWSYQK